MGFHTFHLDINLAPVTYSNFTFTVTLLSLLLIYAFPFFSPNSRFITGRFVLYNRLSLWGMAPIFGNGIGGLFGN
jgi:hypothetical protein